MSRPLLVISTLFRSAGIAFLVALLFPAAASSQNGPDDPLYLQRTTVPIQLDGFVTDEEWGDIDPLPLVQYQPVFGAEMSVPTEIRVAYDDHYLYVAGRLYDSTGDIRANSLYRDRYSGDDTFAIILDTFDDNESGLWFFTTPNGVRFDMSLSNDLNSNGGGPFGSVVNSSWNTYWDTATQRTDTSWTAEIRIPYSSLGFEDVNGRVEMGMSTYRFVARLNERHLFPATPPNWDMAFAKPSKTQKVILEGVHAQRPIYITPYGLAGPNMTSTLNDSETEYVIDNDPRLDAGLDVKYNVTSNLTADLTVNTDFAQVEADDQQVNLSRFSLFFPEKRQFFQERSGVFEFSQAFEDRLFHSRQIGLYEEEIIPIYGGARLVGRVNSLDVGILNMQTAESTYLPSENFGVARLRKRVLNPYSTAGAIFTDRVGVDGSYNLAYGLDGIVRVVGDEYATLSFAQTFDDTVQATVDFNFLEAALIYTQWERRTDQGLNYSAFYQRNGRDYDPGIGYVRRENVTQVFARIGYGWFAPDDWSIRKVDPSVYTSDYLRNGEDTYESAYFGGQVNVEFKSSAIANLHWEWSYEDIRDDTLSLPENTEILPGTYRFIQFQSGYEFPEVNLLRGGFEIDGGSFYGGYSMTVGATPTWNMSRHIELNAAYSFTYARFPDSDQDFTVHLGRLRAQIGFNTKASLAAFIQYNSADDVFAANVRFRYNFREGQDLWIVFNEGINTDRLAYDPIPPKTGYRTALVKYTYTFTL